MPIAGLAHVRNSYPCIWKDPEAAPWRCFIGYPNRSPMCPLGFTGNPLCSGTRFITASNKFRYYSPARFYTEEELLANALDKRVFGYG